MEQFIIKTVHLFPELNKLLIELIKSMNNQDWCKKTQFPNWTVKDIIAHLLDTSIRRLSSQRDKYQFDNGENIKTYHDLVEYITKLADNWTNVVKGVSPKILVELLDKYQNDLYLFFITLDPFNKAHFPVNWAGESESFNWFDIAREYTERWHHQMQIREALGREPIFSRHIYYPVLNTFMQALPYHFREINKKDGYLLAVKITGDAGGIWYIQWKSNNKKLIYNTETKPDTIITITQEIAWKMFTKWNNLSVNKEYKIEGDIELGNHLLTMTCILIS